MTTDTAEHRRLREHSERTANWKHWGPYLSERSWGTVREDYSANGNAWAHFTHDQARSRVYRWGEDGIGGFSDRNQYLCFGLGLWNEKDPIIKERMFGVTGEEGNHGEDVKELYFYLDSTPTHSYMKMLYKYPIAEFPYKQLVDENRKRTREEDEYEIIDTGVFDRCRYFDCTIEYAKAAINDIVIKITVSNRSLEQAPLHILPTFWFRNTWSWGYPNGPMRDTSEKPQIELLEVRKDCAWLKATHCALGTYQIYYSPAQKLLFTENETNNQLLFGSKNESPYVKDAFHRFLVNKEPDALNMAGVGTKAAACYSLNLAGGETKTIWLRFSEHEQQNPLADVEQILEARKADADQFCQALHSPALSAEEKLVQRQAMAGMLWTKQLYYYDVEQWLRGDPTMKPLPKSRSAIRNVHWEHLVNFDIISMPDKWEFPWYAAWDLAFHSVALALVDPEFAKRQLELITREWYMHPNGQFPAYEWSFSDVNPPVHAWAVWRVYKIDSKATGVKDRAFLEGMFHKMLLNFTWWVNRKDAAGRNVFEGGFLGLDNIGVFDRSAKLPGGGRIDQADATAWMAGYCLTMMEIALELAAETPVYQDSASKFLEHFLRVAHAMTNIGGDTPLWDEKDGFFYDMMHFPDGRSMPLKVRSLVGLLPVVVADTIEPDCLRKMPDFKRRLKWFVLNRPHLSGNMARIDVPGVGKRRLASLLTRDRLTRVLAFMFDENEFLSPYGLRSMSKYHEQHPFAMEVGGEKHSVSYEPAESRSAMFGGNSNWRGPIWFPTNLLIIESLQRYHHYYGEDFKIEYPTHSGKFLNLDQIAADLSRRLSRIFLKDKVGVRAFYGKNKLFQHDPYFKDLLLFNEYFHGDSGAGLGASHQTGWTGLVAKLLQQSGG